MAIEFSEYVRGLPDLEDQISMVDQFKEAGGLNPDYFYPMVGSADPDDAVRPEDLAGLPKQTVTVHLAPGDAPVQKEVYMDGDDWAIEQKDVEQINAIGDPFGER